jgi:hypothetical protein
MDDDNGTDSGSARVISGVDGTILYTFYGDSPGDHLGCAVGGAGDVDGDGYDDLVVGAVKDDDNGDQCGSARLYSGKDGTVLCTFYGDTAHDHLGISVSGAGDVNCDGKADIIVGAYGYDTNGSNSGRAFVFADAGSGDDPPDVTITAPANGATVSGSSVQITATATDDGFISKVEFYVDGTLASTDYASPYGTTWDSTQVSDGSHTILAKATDNSGQTDTHSISLTVDNIPNPLSLTSISPNSVRAGKSVNVTVKGTRFAGGASLTLENGSGPDVAVTNVVVVDSTSITARISAARSTSKGTWSWDVVVTNPDGASARLAGGFAVRK